MKQEQLHSGLKRLFLHAIAKDYLQVAKDHEKHQRSYEQYLLSLVEIELREKDRIKTQRLIKEAKIPLVKLVEEFDFSSRTGINAQEVARLSDGQWVKSGSNVVLYGNFGLGKTHLAMAITRNLCQKGYRCLYISATAFINELCVAQKSLTLSTLLKKLDRFDLIAIDELGYIAQTQEGADLFFQVISQRYERKSLMITTNLVYSDWDKVFLSKISTAAAVDKIIHHCETFNIQGPRWREKTAKQNLAKKQKNEVALM